MNNGYPTNDVLPFAQKYLNPGSVNTSTDASTATTFTFPSPVYLQEGVKYAIRITSRARRVEFQYGDTTQGGTKHTSMGAMFPATSITSERKEGVVNHYLVMRTLKARFKAVSGTVTLQNEPVGEEYTQEIEGEFLDIGDALIPNSLITDAISDKNPRGNIRYYMGVDIARTGRDETVFTVIKVDDDDNVYVGSIFMRYPSSLSMSSMYIHYLHV